MKTAFKEYCNPRKNLTYERHKFNTRAQVKNETIDQYVTVLRTLAATCEFENLHDGLIRDRIVYGIRSQILKERLLRETDLSLQRATDKGRATEISWEQVKSLNGENKTNIDAIRKYRRSRSRPPNDKSHKSYKKPEDTHPPNKACGNCGRSHAPKSCPAYSKPCNHCRKLGHFPRLCRSRKKPVNDRELESDNSKHGIDMVNAPSTSTEKEPALA